MPRQTKTAKSMKAKRRKVTRIAHPSADAFAPEVVERSAFRSAAPIPPPPTPAKGAWGFEIKYQSAERSGKTGYAVLRDPQGEYAGTVPEFRAAQIVDALNRAEPQPSGTQHFWIEWNWDENRFTTQADLTQEQARQIETLLETRAAQVQDIGKPEVWSPPTVHSTFDEVRKEIVEALGGDTCPKCFASLDDNPAHDCPGKG